MERSKIAATAAAVFLTTAAGMVAIGANLGLLRLGAPDTKVGTLSPVATPAPSTPTTPPAALTPVTTPEPDPAFDTTPVADGASSGSAAWSPAPQATTWTVTDTTTAPPPGPAATAPPTTARTAEPGDAPPTASRGGSGDD